MAEAGSAKQGGRRSLACYLFCQNIDPLSLSRSGGLQSSACLPICVRLMSSEARLGTMGITGRGRISEEDLFIIALD